MAFDEFFNDSHLTFTGGCITGGKDGGVEVRHAYFSMYGGTIIGNSSSNHGSGVYLDENSIFFKIQKIGLVLFSWILFCNQVDLGRKRKAALANNNTF